MDKLTLLESAKVVQRLAKNGEHYLALCASMGTSRIAASRFEEISQRGPESGAANAAIVAMIELSSEWSAPKAKRVADALDSLARSQRASRMTEEDQDGLRRLAKYFRRLLASEQKSPKAGKTPRPKL